MYSKDDKDAFDILGGKQVPDAKPEIVEDMEIWRTALYVRRNRRHLPPLRLPESVTKKAKSQKLPRLPLLTWQKLSPAWTSAIAFSAVGIFLVALFIPLNWTVNNGQPESSSGETKKYIPPKEDYLGKIIIHNPQEVNKFYKAIKEIIGESKIEIQTDENFWILIFFWQPEQVEALDKILVPYNIKIKDVVKRGFTGGVLELIYENPKTTP